jgi:hypothetical protein
MQPDVKTAGDIDTDIMYDVAIMRISKMEDNFRNIWWVRFGTFDKCPIKK